LRRRPANRHALPRTDPPDQLKASSDPIAVFLNAKAVNETFKARLTRLEFEERSGLLILATKAGEYASQWSAIVGDALSAFADSRDAPRGRRKE
jgi:hypothetical protein